MFIITPPIPMRPYPPPPPPRPLPCLCPHAATSHFPEGGLWPRCQLAACLCKSEEKYSYVEARHNYFFLFIAFSISSKPSVLAIVATKEFLRFWSEGDILSDGTADVVDVVYVNIVTWSVGCVGVGEVAKGEQLIVNQGQEWMGIRATIKKAGYLSK